MDVAQGVASAGHLTKVGTFTDEDATDGASTGRLWSH